MKHKTLLISRKERMPAIEKRQPYGCGCRAYRDVFTATFQLRVSFLLVSVVNIIMAGLLLPQPCYASNDKTPETSKIETSKIETSKIETSPLIQGLKNAILSTPYSALITHTSVDVVPVVDAGSDDDYVEEKQIYHAKVLETYRGETRKNISYTMIVEKGEAAIINRGPVVVVLCKRNNIFFWPGTGSVFPATEEVIRISKLTGQSIGLVQQFFSYCE